MSAVNEDLDRMAASHGFQVFWLGFLASANAYEMGIPAVPLGDLVCPGRLEAHRQCPVASASAGGASDRRKRRGSRRRCAAGEQRTADYYVSALPFERLPAVIPELEFESRRLRAFAHHRHPLVVRSQPHATAACHAAGSDHAVDVQQIRRPIFAIGGERVAQSGGNEPRADVIALAVRELAEFFPRAKEAKLEKAHVVKEIRATFSARPGLEQAAAAERDQVPESLPGGRLDAIAAGRPPWKARFAADIWRPRRSRAQPVTAAKVSAARISPEDLSDEAYARVLMRLCGE